LGKAILLFFLISLWGCGNSTNPEPSLQDNRPQPVERESESTGEAALQSQPIENSLIPSEERGLVAHKINLDLDPREEEVILTINPQRTEQPVKLWIIDYNEVRQEEEISFTDFPGVTNPDNISLEFEDLLGDFSLEIICQGMTINNTRSIDIWRRDSSQSVRNSFSRIFQLQTPGSITVDRRQRSKGYIDGQKPGISFPIEVLEKDTSKEDSFDLIKKTYYWRYNQDQYALSKEETLSGQQVEAQHLKDLYRANSTRYLEYLGGSWIHQKTGGTVFLDPQGRTLSYVQGSVQEIYNITRTYKGIYNRIEVYSENELVPSVKRYSTISLRALDSMIMNIEEIDGWKRTTDEEWSGLYTRPEGAYSPHLEEPEIPQPSGLYSDSLGMQIFFDLPHYTMKESGGISHKGIANIFALDNSLILQLKEINDNGTEGEDRSFLVKGEVLTDKYKEIRSLILQEGDLTNSGVKLFDEAPIRLEQIEIFGELR